MNSKTAAEDFPKEIFLRLSGSLIFIFFFGKFPHFLLKFHFFYLQIYEK